MSPHRITIELPIFVQHVLSVLRAMGHETYVAGGAVRDSLLGRKPKDWDIATAATPDQVLQIFPKAIPTGIQYGTVTVMLDGMPIEITTFRKDGAYTDGRRPDTVEYSKAPWDDVDRRDSTVNALLYDGTAVVDYVLGLHDLENGIIRAVGNPGQRINEDALRMLRYIRQANQLGFEIEEQTFKSIKLHAHLITRVSVERIREELMKILVSGTPAYGMDMLREAGLLYHIMPDLDSLFGFEQFSKFHHRCVWGHTLDVVEKVPANPIVRLAALFHDIGKPATFTRGEDGVGHFYEHHVRGEAMTREIMLGFNFSTSEIDQVTTLVREHMSQRGNPHLTKRTIKRFINRVGQDNLENLFDLMLADAISHRAPFFYGVEKVVLLRKGAVEILTSKEPLTVKDLQFSGQDLKAMGIVPGPIYSQVLNALLEDVLEDPSRNTYDYLNVAARVAYSTMLSAKEAA